MASGLVLREHTFGGIDDTIPEQLIQQCVALLEQALPVPAGMDQGRGVRQDRQHGAFRPGKFICGTAEIAPGRSIQSHDIASEGRVGRIQAEDLILGTAPLQPCRQHHLPELLGQGAGLVGAAQAYDLHRQRAGAADHPLPAQVLL